MDWGCGMCFGVSCNGGTLKSAWYCNAAIPSSYVCICIYNYMIYICIRAIFRLFVLLYTSCISIINRWLRSPSPSMLGNFKKYGEMQKSNHMKHTKSMNSFKTSICHLKFPVDREVTRIGRRAKSCWAAWMGLTLSIRCCWELVSFWLYPTFLIAVNTYVECYDISINLHWL